MLGPGGTPEVRLGMGEQREVTLGMTQDKCILGACKWSQLEGGRMGENVKEVDRETVWKARR